MASNFHVVNVSPMVSLASSIHAGPRIFAFLLGSGISTSAGLPAGREVVADLVGRLATLEDEDPGDDPIAWYQIRHGKSPDYSELVEVLAPSPADRVNLLKGYFKQSNDDEREAIEPSAAHRALAGLVADGYVSVIVTTNFDRLMERALEDKGIPAAVVTNLLSDEDVMPLAHSEITIIKVNGDYLSPTFRNTTKELTTYDEAMNRLLDEVFSQYGLVVCGWSAEWDSALSDALERSQSRRFSAYWLHKGPPGSVAESLIAHRDARPIRIEDADSTFAALVDDITDLANASHLNPTTTELTVARMKRLISNDGDAIKLRDLMIHETENAISLIADFEVVRHVSEGREAHIRERMRSYEEATMTLLRLLVVGALLSDQPDHNRIWAECVRRLANRDMHLRNGDVDKINLQYYPALLAIYAIALGSAAGDRVEPIAHTLASVKVNRPFPTFSGTGPLPVTVSIEALHISLYPANIDRNNPRQKSDHLFKIMCETAGAELPSGKQFEDYFDEAEYLLALASDAQLKASIPYWHAPVGRAAIRLLRERGYPDGLVERHKDILMSKQVFRDSRHLNDTRDTYNGEFQRLREWLNPFWSSMHQE